MRTLYSVKRMFVVFLSNKKCLMTTFQLLFDNPILWWPNGMGKQFLYNVELSIDVKGFGESDSWSHPFGFRKIESTIDAATGGRY